MNIENNRTAPIRPGEELPVERLDAYLREHLPEARGDLAIEQFPQGHSNLTYLVRLGELELVLRRPPFGNQVKSAHDMGREYRVLSRMCEVYAPAPRPYFYCEDESVIGAPFYVMERRRGLMLGRGAATQSIDRETARRLSIAAIDNLALLHSLDYHAAGLGDLGKPAGYVERQVSGWTKRYEQARTGDVPTLERTARWLSENLPAESGAAVIHNDYKYDNLLVDAEDPTRITAVLDWEMATVGDPLMDFGTTLAYWVEAEDPPGLRKAAVGPTELPGSLTRQELVRQYERQSGRAVPNVLFYYCFGLFKVAVIVQQIYARFARGHTQDPRFSRLDQVVAVMSQQAANALDSGQV